MVVRFCVSAVVYVSAAEQAFVLRMGGDDLAERFCPPHRLFHKRGVLHALAVVGKRHDARRQLFHIRQFFPSFPLGDTAVRINRNQSVFSNRLFFRGEVLDAVGKGV